ncbi:protein mono-ADP-ribosyltransferase TIPARP-like [Protopterus annectens]|uniref:protein mono-ADP-ribosyltransferase TIPARP-like n=1 Tax=Protopterus annectens TaxID=7888 RepID=UPI001CFACFA9|nr:protein mono-ADP-ribosyltransferase TIPARP-like [Protopterus annectens]XP_043935557.1 protein mono-ADP-ribosyltransferase TIPARP-like [Protopterus annectens]
MDQVTEGSHMFSVPLPRQNRVCLIPVILPNVSTPCSTASRLPAGRKRASPQESTEPKVPMYQYVLPCTSPVPFKSNSSDNKVVIKVLVESTSTPTQAQILPQIDDSSLGQPHEILDLSLLREEITVEYPWMNQARSHIHQKDDIRICDVFLLGGCSRVYACPFHHTPLPYHWQMRRRDTKYWISMGGLCQEQLERLYCNVKNEFVTLKAGDRVTSLNLQTLWLTDNLFQYDKVRRLSNTTDDEINPYFPTTWLLFWEEMGEWKPYDEPLATELNAAFEKGMWNHAFVANGKNYNINLKGFIQRNITTGYCRYIRRRPIFRSEMDMHPYLKTITDNYMASPSDPCPEVSSADPFAPSISEYPPTWVATPAEIPYTQILVLRSEVSYRKIYHKFFETMSESEVMVEAIYKIQNDFLWNKYSSQKKFMARNLKGEETSQLEKHLFHGTTENSVTAIYKLNFDPRVSGKNGTHYGDGTYFAQNAQYSNTYAIPSNNGCRYMFLAKVLVGKYARGFSSYRRPPPLQSSCPDSSLYDSCVDNVINPTIFVIFDSCQCYPHFLIKYRNLTNQVQLDS